MAGRFNQIWFPVLAGLAFLAGAAMPAIAAPILGENQEQEIITPSPTPFVRPTELRSGATVIQFSVLPSLANPDRFETTIFVQQGGHRQVCVNLSTPAIIVRSYQTDADPFEPDIPSRIEGQKSDDVGELAGFNSKKLFIRPRGTDDRFDLPDEPFSVGRFEGVFRRDDIECDQELTEGDFACISEVIRTSNCDLSRHASLIRGLRIVIALNSTQLPAPAAGPAAGSPPNGLAGNNFGAQDGLTPSSGTTGAAPGFSGSFGGGAGGGGLILVPDVVGLPFTSAVSVITSSGLVVGNVTQTSSSSASLFQGWIIGTAHAETGPPDGTVKFQVPPGGAFVPPGSTVSLVVQFGGIDGAVPEPSALIIFILGLIFMAAIYWWNRRQTAKRLPQA